MIMIIVSEATDLRKEDENDLPDTRRASWPPQKRSLLTVVAPAHPSLNGFANLDERRPQVRRNETILEISAQYMRLLN